MSLRRYRTATGSRNFPKQLIANGKALSRLATNTTCPQRYPTSKDFLIVGQKNRASRRRLPRLLQFSVPNVRHPEATWPRSSRRLLKRLRAPRPELVQVTWEV